MPSIHCYCDEAIGATLRPIPCGLSILRESAFLDAKNKATRIMASAQLDEHLDRAIMVEQFDFLNPAHRLAVQCENCERILVTGDTWSAVQVFRHEREAVPADTIGRGSAGLFTQGIPESSERDPATEVRCPCGNKIDTTHKPWPRGLVLFSEEFSWAVSDELYGALEAGASREELSDQLLDQLLNPANPAFRYAVQCENCTRMLVLNDANEIVDGFVEHPDDVPPDTTGRGSKGFFED